MSDIENTVVMETEPAANSSESRTASRWIDEEAASPEQNPKQKKKGPFIQIPVIISFCLVALALIAFFIYRTFFIAEPEGVIWVWSSEDEDVNWYYEFKDDDTLKTYVGSFEVTTTYHKDKSSDDEFKLTVTSNSPEIQQLGCISLGHEMLYTISGSRLAGEQEMTITYPEDEEKNEFVLKQTDELPSMQGRP